MLKLILLLLLPLTLNAQYGRYNLNTVDGHTKEGYVVLTVASIRVYYDSVETKYPVINTTTDRQDLYLLLEGCSENQFYRGAAVFTQNTSSQGMGGYRRHYSTLFIEIRARNRYEATRYSIYNDETP